MDRRQYTRCTPLLHRCGCLVGRASVCNTQDGGVGGRAVTTAPTANATAILSIGDVTTQCGTVAADICEPSTAVVIIIFHIRTHRPSTNEDSSRCRIYVINKMYFNILSEIIIVIRRCLSTRFSRRVA